MPEVTEPSVRRTTKADAENLEQAFLDYNEALSASGLVPVPIIANGAAVEAALRGRGMEHHRISQWGWWDVVAAHQLARILRREKVAAAITHGKRALSLAAPAFGAVTPVIAVAHNYNRGRFDRACAVIATTADLGRIIGDRYRFADKPWIIPNIVRITRPPPAQASFRDPPVVGAIGRMVKKKGFETFCAALSILRARGVPIKAVIAGDGPDRPALDQQIRALGLANHVMLMGWIEGASAKEAFWKDIDIFCLPSQHEPFGIVLLEAFAAGKPVITTDTEGPSSIADASDAVIVDKSDPHALARGLQALLERPDDAHRLAVNGYNKVAAHYNPDVLATRLNAVIRQVLS